MEKIDVKEKIINSLENIGIFIDISSATDVDLNNYIEDSIQFMSMIVQLEKIFNTEIPSDLLLFDNFDSIEKICLMFSELVNTQET